MPRNAPRPDRAKAVICIETGKIWPSVTECAAYFEVTANSIIFRLRNKMKNKSNVPKLYNVTLQYLETPVAKH